MFSIVYLTNKKLCLYKCAWFRAPQRLHKWPRLTRTIPTFTLHCPWLRKHIHILLYSWVHWIKIYLLIPTYHNILMPVHNTYGGSCPKFTKVLSINNSIYPYYKLIFRQNIQNQKVTKMHKLLPKHFRLFITLIPYIINLMRRSWKPINIELYKK